MQAFLIERTRRHQEQALHRERHLLQQHAGAYTQVAGKDILVFSTNDYLGLAQHPQLIKTLQQAATRYGIGGQSSPIVAGHLAIHREVEKAFAEFLHYENALLFSCGFMANQGVISALLTKEDVIFADKYVHASIIDASRLSHAKLIRYPHLNSEQLGKSLTKVPANKKLLVTDSVFSMQGDIAELPLYAKLAKAHQATLMVDDAHGIGVLGQTGAGAKEHFNLSAQDIPILVCPLAKAFGVMGAVVAGSHALIEYLLQFSRSYTYSTALPPALAEVALHSLAIVKQEPWRREKLSQLIDFFKKTACNYALTVLPSTTPIQCVAIGDAHKAYIISQQLLKKGFLLNSMRPPTVAKNSSLLRISLTCHHTEKQIQQLLSCLKEIIDEKFN